MLKASFTYSNALFKEAGSLPVGEKKKTLWDLQELSVTSQGG